MLCDPAQAVRPPGDTRGDDGASRTEPARSPGAAAPRPPPPATPDDTSATPRSRAASGTDSELAPPVAALRIRRAVLLRRRELRHKDADELSRKRY